jgi:hypothetical protein
MTLTLVPMLLAGGSISPDARQALCENRLEDAARLLMRDSGLTQAEANDLLGLDVADSSIRSTSSNRSKRRERR